MSDNTILMYNAVVAAASVVITVCQDQLTKPDRQRKKRSVWVRPLFQRRLQFGAYNLLMSELRTSSDLYAGFTRMAPEDFDCLLEKIRPFVTGSSQFRQPIPPDLKLAVTLRYLATGDFESFMYLHCSSAT